MNTELCNVDACDTLKHLCSQHSTKETRTMKTSPAVYVACLSCYNAGKLKGEWITLDGKDSEDVSAEIQTMLDTCLPIDGPHEEYAFHDYEGMPRGLSEHESIDDLVEIASLMEEHPESFSLLLEHLGGDVQETKERMEDFRGLQDERWGYAYDLYEREHQDSMPQELWNSIDWERVTTGMESGSLLILRTSDFRYAVWA